MVARSRHTNVVLVRSGIRTHHGHRHVSRPKGQSCNIIYSDSVAGRLRFLSEGVTGRITQDSKRIILAASENATTGSTKISPASFVEVVAPVLGVPVQTDESPREQPDQPV